MPFPRILSLLDEFKNCCSLRDWKAYEADDLIEAENEHHKLFWIRILHPDNFEKVVNNPLCAICEGMSYRTVKLSYLAWVLSKQPSPKIRFYLTDEEPSLLKKVAIYDLSQAYQG